MSTKITGLSALNVRAVDEIATGKVAYSESFRFLGEWAWRDEVVDLDVPDIIATAKTTATTATFDGTPYEAIQGLQRVIAQLPKRGHPKASLHAVRRRLEALL